MTAAIIPKWLEVFFSHILMILVLEVNNHHKPVASRTKGAGCDIDGGTTPLSYCSTTIGLAHAGAGCKLQAGSVHPTPRPMKFTPSICFSAVLLLGSALLAQADPGAPGIIRIKTGVTAALTDETGVVWQADTGFADGETSDRPGLAIANTKTPSLYQTERYSMTAFHQKLPNGKYTVKLHFAETYEGITGPGERVFSFKVEGKEFKDFDVSKKAGGVLRAYIETIEVEVTDGSLDITFTAQTENPEINALEIIPAPAEKK
jgi:hypothetical protein